MSNQLEAHLRCPLCLSVLSKKRRILVCSKNKHRFNIKQGIPILLDYPNLPIHSQKQQSYFEKNINSNIIDSLTNLKYWKIKYLERFSNNFNEIKNKLVCEVGTGGGYMAIGLAKLGAKVIACDITIKNLVILRKLSKALGLEHNLLFVCCSVHQLPFRKNSYDYFVINSVLEHIPEEARVIGEIERTLKRGGGLMITLPVKYKFINPLLLPLNYLHDKRIGHLRRYDDNSLRSKFSGFQIKRLYFTGHTKKVLKVITNIIIKVFDEKAIEEEDSKLDRIKLWSSNLIAFLFKK